MDVWQGHDPHCKSCIAVNTCPCTSGLQWVFPLVIKLGYVIYPVTASFQNTYQSHGMWMVWGVDLVPNVHKLHLASSFRTGNGVSSTMRTGSGGLALWAGKATLTRGINLILLWN